MVCHCCRSNKINTKLIFSKKYFSCKNCGLLFCNASGEENSVAKIKKHYKNIDPYEEVALSKEMFFNKALDILDIPKNDKRILDIGCGYGHFLNIAKKRGWMIYGIEIVEDAIKNLNEEHKGSKIFFSSLEDGTFKTNCFDAITLWDVLVIVDDPSKILQECYRVLSKGGKLGIRVRNVTFQKFAYYCYTFTKRIAPWFEFKNPSVFHKYCFSADSIYQLLAQFDYKNIKIINSPLTSGDPYSHYKNPYFIKMIKFVTQLFSNFVYYLTNGKVLTGPSLLIWAEKP